MILFLQLISLFSLAVIHASTSNNKYNQERLAACRVAEYWSQCPSSNTTDIVGYNFKTAFFVQTGSDVSNNKINLFSPGLYKPTKTLRVLNFTEDFNGLPERTLTGWLPGDFFIFDPEFAGSHASTFRKKLSWGQNKDAFALIYSMNRLYEAGVKRLTLHAQCFGTSRYTHALYYLSKNQQSNDVENFFLKANIDRIRKEELLESIETICLQTPLKQASDGIIATLNSFLEKPLNITNALSHIAAASFLSKAAYFDHNPQKQKLFLFGVGLFLLPTIFRISNLLFGIDQKVVRRCVLPYYCNYNPSEFTEFEMLKKLQYMVNEYPEKAFFMTTAKNDRVVGNWNVAEFFESFPVAPDRKYLVPSPQFGHCKVTQQQIVAKNAFLRRYGSSYYNFSKEELTQGEKTLNFAQEGQSLNIKEYIEYMESEDNEF